ncbi:MAG: dicarboxylate/amino acid:cation symporter [Planctomycetes bacterium]|nr:dicarboxylate/amino acid:cation symporter [Planctomycetota bacterium]
MATNDNNVEATSQLTRNKAIPLHYKILIGLVTGAFLGSIAKYAWADESSLNWIVGNITKPAGQIFMRMIFMVVVPLIFTALVTGVAGIKDLAKLGRVGIKTLLFTIMISTIAAAIGIFLANSIKPGVGISKEAQGKLKESIVSKGAQESVRKAGETKSITDTIVDLIPKNPLEEATAAFNPDHRGGGLLAVMFFALIFGVALSLSKSEKTEVVVQFMEGVFTVLMKIIDFAMKLAPYGVGALLFSVTATLGFDALLTLGKFVIVVLAGLALHQFGVYSLLIYFVIKMNPLTFFKKIQEAMLVAFSTSSSNVTLPTSIRVSQDNLKIPRDISNFVLTLGSTANQNGTALFEGVTVLFLAQFFGIQLDLGSQIIVMLMAILGGIGTAGVPGGSLPVIVVILQSVGVPGEAIGLIIGVDRILDMCRTVTNVSGDLVVAAYVARSEQSRN